MDTRWDAIVVGAGAMGTSAALHIARRGRQCLVLERFAFGHERGSSHGPTRIFRLSYHHPDYVRLARRALVEWRELEEVAGERLLVQTGGLEVGPGAEIAAQALSKAGEASSWLSSGEVRERWPGLTPDAGVDLLYQPDAGVTLAAATVRAQAEAAARAGAILKEGVVAEAIVPHEKSVEIRTEDGSWSTPVAVVTAGAWAGPLLAAAGIPLPLRVSQEQVLYLREGNGTPLPSLIEWLPPPASPPYLVPHPTDPGVVKIGQHAGTATVTAESRTFDPDPTRLEEDRAWAARWLGMPGDEVRTETCLYTNTPDQDFVIDRVGPVVVAAGFSGHGFKFVPLVGRMLADLALDGDPGIPLDRFRASRF
jgi:sarcosine oxidase